MDYSKQGPPPGYPPPGYPPYPGPGYAPNPGMPPPQQAPYGGAVYYGSQPPNATAYPPPPAGFHGGPMYGSGDPEMGGRPPPQQAPKNYSLSFSDQSIRHAFIRKVYAILMIQLAVVVGLIAIFVFERNTRLWVQQHSWLYFVSYAVFLVSYIAIVCCESVRRRFPGNVIALVILTLSIGYMTAMISAYHSTDIVFIAMGICALCCFSIILFAMNTKYDFTSWVGVMFVVMMVLFLFSIFAVIFGLFRNNWVVAVYGGIMALVFMVFLAIDTQMIVGGKKYSFNPEDYILAVVQLFMDIIFIFWFLLQLLGAVNSS